MEVKRLNYNKVCRGKSFDPSYLKMAVEEALRIFMRKNNKEEDYPLQIKDLKEINDYILHIWSNQEIYVNY